MKIKNMGLSIPLAVEKQSRMTTKKTHKNLSDNFIKQAERDFARYKEMQK